MYYWLRVFFCCCAINMAVANPVDVVVNTSAAIQTANDQWQGLVKLHTADELLQLLTRAEQFFSETSTDKPLQPVVIVLHGDEIGLFKRSQYQANKNLVDLAARLEAFDVVDLKVCEHWLTSQQVEPSRLPAFLQTVPNGAQEVTRLQQAGYASF